MNEKAAVLLLPVSNLLVNSGFSVPPKRAPLSPCCTLFGFIYCRYVPVCRSLANQFKTLLVHLFFPVGNSTECEEYIKNCEDGQVSDIEKAFEKRVLETVSVMMKQKIEEEKEEIRNEVLLEVGILYGASGLFGDYTSSIMVIAILVVMALVCGVTIAVTIKAAAIWKTITFWRDSLGLEKLLNRKKRDADLEAAKGESMPMTTKT